MKKSLLAFLIAAAPLFVFAQLPSYLPTDGLVGWWPFNGNANDESGNGNDGTVNGAILTSDRFGVNNAAFNFNSDSQNINCGNSPSFGLTTNTSLTINYWTLSSNNRWPFISKYQNLNSSNSNYGIGNDAGNFIVTGNGSNSVQISSNSTSNWVNLCFVLNGLSDSVSTYINGVFMSTNYITVSTTVSTNNLLFGPRFNPITNNYQIPNGDLDDITIYNRALTPEEITALYTGIPTNNNGGGNTATATVPAGISYQAVARNAQGQPLSDTDVQVKFTLLADSLTGAAEYSESHSLTTNSLGLFTTAFGAGAPETGTFASINWASGSKYLKVELDAGSGFVDMGSQQLMSVPYALQAKKSTLLENNSLPVFSDNAAALAGGLQAGQMYRTATGDLKIVY
jgi:hypothetical protein